MFYIFYREAMTIFVQAGRSDKRSVCVCGQFRSFEIGQKGVFFKGVIIKKAEPSLLCQY